MAPRRLVVVRHAKAEPYAATDHVRELTDRGRRDALAAGEYLRSIGVVPDHAVVSTSARTKQTWELVAAGAGAGGEAVYDDAVYAGSPDVVLEALRTVPEATTVLAYVGHNPTVSYLAHLVEDGTAEPEPLQEMMGGFPPGSVAVFEVAGPWAKLAEETGRLVAFRPGGKG